jgi:hypothetical protein
MRTESRRTRASSMLMFALVIAAACSPGTLPGSPSLVTTGGGGARYNGTLTTRRIGGTFTIVETPQTLSLSLTLRTPDQITGRLDVGGNAGTLAGSISGNLASGSFQATMLISTPAQQGTVTTICEGRGNVAGTLAGLNLVINAASVTYDNCPGLTTSSSGQGLAVSPVPGSTPNRANVVISIIGGTRVALSSCASGVPGYPFVVEISETNGINVTLDATFVAEERRASGGMSVDMFDMPFTDLPGGTRRTYYVCTPSAGTYQAFISGTDASGTRIRVASPLVTLG